MKRCPKNRKVYNYVISNQSLKNCNVEHCFLLLFFLFFFLLNLQAPFRSCYTFRLWHPSSFANLSCVWGQGCSEAARSRTEGFPVIAPRQTQGNREQINLGCAGHQEAPSSRTFRIEADISSPSCILRSLAPKAHLRTGMIEFHFSLFKELVDSGLWIRVGEHPTGNPVTWIS